MFLSNKNLQRIIKNKGTGTKLSIYIPTHPASNSSTLAQDAIRFKNALQNIKANKTYDEHELGGTMKKLESLLDDLDFWKRRAMGLAVFADSRGYETVDLNYEITEMQYVQDAFVISLLAVMLSIGTGYYVLDINLTKPRLVHFTSSAKEAVAIESMPGSFEETVERDEYRKQQQHQSIAGNTYHGHGNEGALDEDTLRYYKLIAKCVNDYLIDHDEPLLLAGTKNRIGHMRPLLKYHNVMEETVEGNNEELNEQELLDVSDTLIKNADVAKRGEIVLEVKNTPLSNLALGSAEIQSTIDEGSVATLFLSAFRRTADNIRNTYLASIVLQLPEDIMTVETLVRGVLSQGGEVVAVKQDSFDSDEPRALLRF